VFLGSRVALHLPPILAISVSERDDLAAMTAHQSVKRLLVLPADDTFFGHEHPFEERLVQQPAFHRSSCQVRLVAVLSPSDGLGNYPFDLADTLVG